MKHPCTRRGVAKSIFRQGLCRLALLHRPFCAGVSVWLALWVMVPAAGQASELSELLRSARERDPAYAIAKAEVAAARERTHEAQAALLPVANLTGSSNRSTYLPDNPQGPDRRFTTEQWVVQITQPLFHWSDYYALNQARKQILQMEAQLAAAESELAGRVTTGWFEVLTAQEVLHAVRGQKDATQQQLVMAKRSFELGAVSIADVREAEAKHAVVLAQEARAEGDLFIKRETLSQMTATPIGELDAKPWTTPALASRLGTVNSWIALAQDTNPSIVQARYQLEGARLEIGKARASYLPTIELVANQNVNDASGSASTFDPSSNKTLALGVQVSVPLFSGFSSRAKVKEAIALQDKAYGQQGQACDQVLLSIKQAYSGLRGALLDAKIITLPPIILVILETSVGSPKSAQPPGSA